MVCNPQDNLCGFYVFCDRGRMLRSKYRSVEANGHGSTLHSLPHLQNVQLHSLPCNTYLLRLGVILQQRTGAFWSPCHTLAVIKITLLPFCYHFPLEIGNPASLFHSYELVGSFSIHPSTPNNLQLLRLVLLMKEERGGMKQGRNIDSLNS